MTSRLSYNTYMSMRRSIVGLLVALVTVPLFADAATISELQAQLAALQQQVAVLRAQLPQTAAPQSGAASCPDLSRNLSRGSRGEDVRQLQQFLISQNLLAADSATGFFGSFTERAIQQWQSRNGIVSSGTPATTGYGAVGPRTRAAIVRCSLVPTQTPAPISSAPNIPLAPPYSGEGSPVITPTAASPTPTPASVPNPTPSPATPTLTPQPTPPIPAPTPVVPATPIPTSFAVQTKLVADPSDARSYRADWSSKPNYYLNTTSKDLVVKTIDVTLSGAAYALGEADIDVCFVQDGTHNTRNGVEQFCFTEHKSSGTSEWPQSTVHVVVPGQGLLIRKNDLFACGAQGATALMRSADDDRQIMSDFSCTFTLEIADTGSASLPVQTLRVPYIDERFNSTVSSFVFHANYTQVPRPILGMWSYISSPSTATTLCIGHKSGAAEWSFDCNPVPTPSYDFTSRLSVMSLSIPFAPNDLISSHCTISNPNQTLNNICAAYFFVSVPVKNGAFDPIRVNASIDPGQANKFCHTAYPQNYALTDPILQDDRNLCASILAPAS